MRTQLAAPLSKDQMILRAMGVVMIASFFAAARLYDHFTIQVFECPIKNLTGVDCPTCGLTRSISSLMNCRIASSLLYNPLGLIITAALVVMVLKFTLELIVMRELTIAHEKPAVKMILFAAGVLTTVHWILKIIWTG